MAVSDLTVESHSRNERRRARNRDALVAAARRMFERHGFEGTTIASIAEEADLGFGTFYRYFPDKEAVLFAVFEAAGAEMDAAVFVEDDPAVPAETALARFVERCVITGRRNQDLFALFWQLSLSPRRSPERLIKSEQGPQLPLKLAQALDRIIVRGAQEGIFRVTDPRIAAHFIASGLMLLLTPVPHNTSVEHLSATLTELALGAVGISSSDQAGASARRGR